MTEIQRKVNAYAFPCSVSSVKKVPKFRSTTTLQRCKLIYAFEGGLSGFGGTAACTILISSRTMSVQSREISHSLTKNNEHYTPSPPQKQGGAETFAPRHIINFKTNHQSFNDWHSHILLFLAFDELVHRRNHVLFTLNMKKFK